MSEAAASPPLFSAKGTDAFPDSPALLGGECRSCGARFFPFQSYGCEFCGSPDLVQRPLSGVGRLVASAEVHLSADKRRAAPFVVGSVVTEDGAVVRALLDMPAGTRLAADTPMRAVLVADDIHADRSGEDLRFAPAGQLS